MKSPNCGVFALADRTVERNRVTGDLHDAAGLVDAHAGAFGDFFHRWLPAMLLHQMLLDVPKLGHGFDHVHGHPNGSGVVGDGPGDGLTDPPGGVRRELVAPAVLVLVDRPHQAGVAFLDDVQEGQAAVAVFLGNRNHQAEVAARQIPFALLVFIEDGADDPESVAKFLGVLAQQFDKTGQFFLADLNVFGVVAFRMLFGSGEFAFDASNLLFNGFELAHQRLDAGGSQTALFDQRRHLAATPLNALPQRLGFGAVGGEVGQFIEVGPVGIEHRRNRGDVHRDASGHDFFGVFDRRRDPHGAVEGQRPSCTSCKVLTASVTA